MGLSKPPIQAVIFTLTYFGFGLWPESRTSALTAPSSLRSAPASPHGLLSMGPRASTRLSAISQGAARPAAATLDSSPPSQDLTSAVVASFSSGGVERDPAGKLLLKSLTFDDLRVLVAAVGERPERARDLSRWLYGKDRLLRSLDEAARGDARGRDTLGARFRAAVGAVAAADGGLELERVTTAADGTRKIISRLTAGPGAGATVETVVIPMLQGPQQERRYTVCVSSQVGCAMNCQFCYTGRMGLMANLLTAQIVEQVVVARRLLRDTGDPAVVTGVVFMGMGEPFDNYANVVRAVGILSDPREGPRISAARITVSTVGIVPAIERFCEDPNIRAGLAVSLHATTDATRDWIVPLNRRYPLADLIAVLERYAPRRPHRAAVASLPILAPDSATTDEEGEVEAAGEEGMADPESLREDAFEGNEGDRSSGRQERRPRRRRRIVQIEHTLLAGINDSEDDARRLERLLRRVDCAINLIRFNAHGGAPGFAAAVPERAAAFRAVLTGAGRLCTVRESKGDDEMSACGQLGDVTAVVAAGRQPVALAPRPATAAAPATGAAAAAPATGAAAAAVATPTALTVAEVAATASDRAEAGLAATKPP